MSDLIDAFAFGGQQDIEPLERRYDALIQELIVVARLLPPPVQEAPPPLNLPPEATPAENEALRIECEAIASEYRAPLPAVGAGLIAALQRREDMAPRIRFGTRGFNVTFKNEEEIIAPIAYAVSEELERYIESTPAEGLPGVLVKLRWLIKFYVERIYSTPPATAAL